MKYMSLTKLQNHIKICSFFLVILFSSFYVLPYHKCEVFGDINSRRTDIVTAIEKAGPAVVSLSTAKLVTQRHKDPVMGFRNKFFFQVFLMTTLGVLNKRECRNRWVPVL